MSKKKKEVTFLSASISKLRIGEQKQKTEIDNIHSEPLYK